MVTKPSRGDLDWDVSLNAALDSLQGQITANLDRLVFNVDDHGAAGNGATDDQPAIQALLTAAPKGAIVRLGAKRYALASPLAIPPYVVLEGPSHDRDSVGDAVPALVALAGFSGSAVITMADQATGGYATAHRAACLRNVNIDGVNLTSETVSGIRATGFVHGTVLQNVSIRAMTNHSIDQVSNGSGSPYSWYLENVQIAGSGSATTWDGIRLISTDNVLYRCRTEGVRGYGFYLQGGANNLLVGCRAEWSAKSGYYITGSWGTAQGSGGLIMSGCSTDRSSEYGVLIDSTGNAPILISGLMARRDGRNGFPGTGGGSFAALRGTGSTTPIIVTGMTCYPGVNDDGTGVNSPERGVSFVSCTYVSVEASYLHADVTPFHDGGGNTALYRGVAVGTATGTTAAPTRSLVGAGNLPGPITLTQGGLLTVRGASTNTFLNAQVTGDTQNRYNVTAAGQHAWGSGSAVADVTLARGAANRLDLTTSDLRVGTAGRGLQIAEGSNAKSGTATLVAGAVTVSNTSVTANSRIQLTSQADGGTPGFLRVSARTAGTSFTITSSSGTDTSTVGYFIVEP